MLTVEPFVKIQTPDWAKNASIYQVNTRQFSNEGTFNAIVKELPRIKALGVDILWVMPVHEIGVKNRKGSLGSPYSVKDYYSVNPEFGTPDDFKYLVSSAHECGLKVILDWVPNHSAWDNPLTNEHPEWYIKDHNGNFRPTPWWDWEDIIEFDYSNVALRQYMIDALCHWVKEYDLDGFRCDVAGLVPNDFWKQARAALDKIKPVFMLAEWESRDVHEYGFDMTYAWSWNETLHGIAKQGFPLDKLRKYYSWNERSWPKESIRMTFVSNHDENAWEGTPDEKFGKCLDAAVVLSTLGEGMPLIHNGQEAGETKQLAFFEKDCIEWQPHYMSDFYTHLLSLKKEYSALWNGEHGARMIQVNNSAMQRVLSFVRQDQQSKWLMVFNFSDSPVDVELTDSLFDGEYQQMMSGQTRRMQTLKSAEKNTQKLSLAAWDYRVFLQIY